MKKWLTRVAIGFLILCATVLLTKFWYLNPDSFPSPLRSIGNAVIDWLGVQSAERSADVELVYVLLLSFLVVSGIFCGCLACWKHFYGDHGNAVRRNP
jgi:hypothetical protein